MGNVHHRVQQVSPTHPGSTPVNPVVLDFSGCTAGAKEGKGTKEVEVPLDVIPDLPPLRTGADEVLARRAGLGDEQAFTALVDRHGPALHRHVSRMLGDPDAAQDVLQETLLAAWRGLPGFRGEAGVRTWLFAIARRQAFALCRKGSPARSGVALDVTDAAGQAVAPGGDPAAVSLACGLVHALEAALRLLPEQQRSAWLLKEVEGLTYLQIATVLEVGPAVVRGLLARARATLCAALQEWR